MAKHTAHRMLWTVWALKAVAHTLICCLGLAFAAIILWIAYDVVGMWSAVLWPFAAFWLFLMGIGIASGFALPLDLVSDKAILRRLVRMRDRFQSAWNTYAPRDPYWEYEISPVVQSLYGRELAEAEKSLRMHFGLDPKVRDFPKWNKVRLGLLDLVLRQLGIVVVQVAEGNVAAGRIFLAGEFTSLHDWFYSDRRRYEGEDPKTGDGRAEVRRSQ